MDENGVRSTRRVNTINMEYYDRVSTGYHGRVSTEYHGRVSTEFLMGAHGVPRRAESRSADLAFRLVSFLAMDFSKVG